MAILTGRYGRVRYDPTGTVASPVGLASILSLNGWTLSAKTDYEEVTAFQDTNKVYVPGLRDVSGQVSGFWNSSELTLWSATDATTPGVLELTPNTNESSFTFIGLAYIDADINCTLAVPKVTGNYRAAGPWVLPG